MGNFMSKLISIFEKYDRVRNYIQQLIYIVIIIAVISTLIGVILGTKSCKSNDTIETVEAKYFMNETVIVHESFEVKVYSAKTVNSIEYLKSKKDNFKTSISGNYIEINLDITKLDDGTENNYELGASNFKLRNHSGVYLPLNDIMGLFDINALDVHIDTDENNFVMSNANFSNKKAIKDFTWVGKTLKNGEKMNITLFFRMEEGYQVEKDLMLLEVDLYYSGIGAKKGEDIVLLNCKRK